MQQHYSIEDTCKILAINFFWPFSFRVTNVLFIVEALWDYLPKEAKLEKYIMNMITPLSLLWNTIHLRRIKSSYCAGTTNAFGCNWYKNIEQQLRSGAEQVEGVWSPDTSNWYAIEGIKVEKLWKQINQWKTKKYSPTWWGDRIRALQRIRRRGASPENSPN